MSGLYLRLNKKLLKWLWVLVILGVLASLPLAFVRNETEQDTAQKVEFVLDYRDLLEISDTQTDPRSFVTHQLTEAKKSGIYSMAVYESTLNEFRLSRRIEVFSSHEATALTQTPVLPNENFTYILFADKEAQTKLQPLIEQTFKSLNVKMRPWSFKNQAGMIIEMGMEEANLKTMDPDPIALDTLKEKGFKIVVRMSNRRPFDAAQMNALLARLKQQYGVKRFVIDGETVPGFINENNHEHLDAMAELMKKYNIGLAVIEPLFQKVPQKGFSRLAKNINYDVVRLHPLTEKDGEKLTENITEPELRQREIDVADRLVLAVKDRNIRMVFLNAKAVRSVDKGTIINPLDSIYASLQGENGAIPRIQAAGYSTGVAEKFQPAYPGWQKIAKAVAWVGAVALITLMISYFIPQIALFVFVIGLIGSAGLYVLSPSLFAQALALGAGTSAPTLAIMMAIREARAKHQAKLGSRIAYAIVLLLRTSLVSLIGACFIIGLLNQVTYALVLEQFRGVSVLHLMPIVLVCIYWLLFSEESTYKEKLRKARALLSSNISVLWVVGAALLFAVGFYYLSRTGNEGQTTALERVFRSFLENTLGVRPRTKEFLISHPLFLLGAYLCVKHRKAALLMLTGVIGQASIVDTFAHLHTPLEISLIRVAYGLSFGILIGIVFIIAWEILSRSWRRWTPLLQQE
ncbi:DUF5693 family protein [Paenibacillus xerothermodurans]|uniref:Uncharacterized protein n=1 Tax=Paenibacillus xerothermodurans TaxID=1977292 RepID=A0A2W1N4U3_PAEXE|nr:DUF5693 family protein [Paenibacillus xerothermodurans]PZE19377.1 hypothetical protein CBW46_018585 [Paenibacillus xerothermodurans]